MSHSHGHLHRFDENERSGDARLLGAVVVNILLTVVQVIGRVISGSLSLLADALRALDGVADVHHLHVWDLDESQRSFEGHVVTDQRDARLTEQVKRRMREVLRREGIAHATIECEYGAVSSECREGEVVRQH